MIRFIVFLLIIALFAKPIFKLTYKLTKGVANAIATGLKDMKLPETIIIGGGTGNSLNAVDTFFNLMNVEKVKELSKK